MKNEKKKAKRKTMKPRVPSDAPVTEKEKPTKPEANENVD